MRFIHAGDVHLGNAFSGLDTRHFRAPLQNLITHATQRAFLALIDTAIDEEVDFVLFPGDLYNASAANVYVENIVLTAFERLNAAGIPVILSFGNHDFAALEQTRLPWPDNVEVLPQTVATIQLTTKAGEQVALSGFSYQTPRQEARVIAEFPLHQAQADWHIGLYHGALGGEVYAPFTLAELNAKNYDYWALGHIHIRQTLQEQPFIGYSGSLQGLNRKESGAKGFYVVSDVNGRLVPEFRAVSPLIWDEVTLSSDYADETQLVTAAQNTLTTPNQLVTLRLTGDVTPALAQNIASGLTVQRLQIALPETIGVVKIQLAPVEKALLPQSFDARDWQTALTQTVTREQIQQLLGAKLPPFVYDYFADESVLDELKTAVQQQITALQGDQHAD
ncbi:MAG TPA: DNA repair exonuclease [Lactobacillaceae bacterium]|jgi:DNA repair exonuclease SbcCD nuclease subunit